MELTEAILAILVIVALEAILSVDNAMVLAVMVRPLPEHLRQRALLYGLIGAYVLRGLALLFATLIIQIWWIQLLGGLYLIYLAFNHFRKLPSHQDPHHTAAAIQAAAASFWRIVVMINVVDLAFAVDSVLVAVALSDNFWIILTGVFIGILALRLVAGVFVGLLEKYPRFEAVAFAVVGFAGVKLAIGSWDKLAKEVLSRPEWVTGIDKTQFSLFILGVLILGTIWAMSQRPRIPTAGR